MQVHNRRPRRNTLLAASLAVALGTLTAPAATIAPDTIQLTDGKVLKGLIIKQTPHDVTIQLASGETMIENKDIVRIRNEGSTEDADAVLRPGFLPPWELIVNDLRNMDIIKSFRQIPATIIDNGVFKNVPYHSFRANDVYELNVYGDPQDPAAIEMGIYGPYAFLKEKRRELREFLGSYLSSVEEIRALYSLDLGKAGTQQVGPLTIEITLPVEPDAYGAWWISLYNTKKLNSLRLTEAEYKKLTVPVDEVLTKRGVVKMVEWKVLDILKKPTGIHESHSSRVFADFYRDKTGTFHFESTGTAAPASS